MRLWLLFIFICTSAGSLLAQEVVGGAGVCHVSQNPNLISDLNVQDERTECQIVINTTTGIQYVYDGNQPIGSRWIVPAGTTDFGSGTTGRIAYWATDSTIANSYLSQSLADYLQVDEEIAFRLRPSANFVGAVQGSMMYRTGRFYGVNQSGLWLPFLQENDAIGGSLTGTLPNPGIAVDAIGEDELDETGVTAGTYDPVKSITVDEDGRLVNVVGGPAGQNIIVVNTHAELATTLPSNGDIVHTLGYATPGDGGGGIYHVYSGKLGNYTGDGEVQTSAGNFARYTAKEINVKAFGAVGDSTTTEDFHFQDAVDFKEATGGRVIYIPDGIYRFQEFSNRVVLGSNTTVRGQSKRNTILFRNQFVAGILTANGETDLVFENLNFQTAPEITFATMLNIRRSDTILIRDCMFGIRGERLGGNDYAHQMGFHAVKNFRILDCDFYSVQIKLAGGDAEGCEDVWIDRCSFYDSQDFAISAVSSTPEDVVKNIRITDCTFVGGDGAGTLFFGSDGSLRDRPDTTQNLIITGNTFKGYTDPPPPQENSGQRAINMLGMSPFTENIVIEDNFFDFGDHSSAIALAYGGNGITTNGLSISNNIFQNCDSEAVMELRLGDCRSCKVDNNRFRQTREIEIYVDTLVEHFSFSENQCDSIGSIQVSILNGAHFKDVVMRGNDITTTGAQFTLFSVTGTAGSQFSGVISNGYWQHNENGNIASLNADSVTYDLRINNMRFNKGRNSSFSPTVNGIKLDRIEYFAEMTENRQVTQYGNRFIESNEWHLPPGADDNSATYGGVQAQELQLSGLGAIQVDMPAPNDNTRISFQLEINSEQIDNGTSGIIHFDFFLPSGGGISNQRIFTESNALSNIDQLPIRWTNNSGTLSFFVGDADQSWPIRTTARIVYSRIQSRFNEGAEWRANFPLSQNDDVAIASYSSIQASLEKASLNREKTETTGSCFVRLPNGATVSSNSVNLQDRYFKLTIPFSNQQQERNYCNLEIDIKGEFISSTINLAFKYLGSGLNIYNYETTRLALELRAYTVSRDSNLVLYFGDGTQDWDNAVVTVTDFSNAIPDFYDVPVSRYEYGWKAEFVETLGTINNGPFSPEEHRLEWNSGTNELTLIGAPPVDLSSLASSGGSSPWLVDGFDLFYDGNVRAGTSTRAFSTSFWIQNDVNRWGLSNAISSTPSWNPSLEGGTFVIRDVTDGLTHLAFAPAGSMYLPQVNDAGIQGNNDNQPLLFLNANKAGVVEKVLPGNLQVNNPRGAINLLQNTIDDFDSELSNVQLEVADFGTNLNDVEIDVASLQADVSALQSSTPSYYQAGIAADIPIVDNSISTLPIVLRNANLPGSNFTLTSNEIIPDPSLDGEILEFSVTIAGHHINRLEIVIILEKWNGSSWDVLERVGDYVARDSNNDEGSTALPGLLDPFSDGQKYRIRYITEIDGSPNSDTEITALGTRVTVTSL